MERQNPSSSLQEDIKRPYSSLSNEELENIIKNENHREVNRAFSQLGAQRTKNLLNNISKESINIIFNKLSKTQAANVLSAANQNNIKLIFESLNDETKKSIFFNSPTSIQNKLLLFLPDRERKLWRQLIDENKSIKNEYKSIIASRIENSIEKDALDRLKEIERQAHLRQEQYEARHRQAEEQLESLRNDIARAEEELSEKSKEAQLERELIAIQEKELQAKLKTLREEHEKQIQDRIDVKVPEYVTNAISALESKENEYKGQANEWSKRGLLALKLAVGGALTALVYGAYEFSTTPKQDISWLFFGYLMIKGLIVIGLFAAWAKHAFNQSNAYMHEALKRTERIHAIRFGKLYLEIYGNDVDKQDMKSIFENWNMESHSAFKEIKQTDFQPKVLEKLRDIAEVIKSSKIESETKNQ